MRDEIELQAKQARPEVELIAPQPRMATVVIPVYIAQALHRMQQLHNLGQQEVIVRLRDWQIESAESTD
jgi:hypothetical protein